MHLIAKWCALSLAAVRVHHELAKLGAAGCGHQVEIRLWKLVVLHESVPWGVDHGRTLKKKKKKKNRKERNRKEESGRERRNQGRKKKEERKKEGEEEEEGNWK